MCASVECSCILFLLHGFSCRQKSSARLAFFFFCMKTVHNIDNSLILGCCTSEKELSAILRRVSFFSFCIFTFKKMKPRTCGVYQRTSF
ncbi:unnamed protein product [Ixodes persulcatus]